MNKILIPNYNLITTIITIIVVVALVMYGLWSFLKLLDCKDIVEFDDQDYIKCNCGHVNKLHNKIITKADNQKACIICDKCYKTLYLE